MPNAQLHYGNALEVLPTLRRRSVDALIVDPPYSSGGMFRADRAQPPDEKYTQHESQGRWTDFNGDCRDARSWLHWCAVWLECAHRAVRDRGYVLMFTDWRQLPLATDALQAGGFVWRGIVAWKGRGARAPRGTKGAARKATHAGPFDGCMHVSVKQSDKHHMTGKPTQLMVECVPPGGTVLDPMMGSGTTGVAAIETGRLFIGAESVRPIFNTARRRITAARRIR